MLQLLLFELYNLNGIIESYKKGEGIWSESTDKLALSEKERCEKLIGCEIDNTMVN